MSDDNADHITAREFDGFKEAVVNAISTAESGIHKRLDGTDRRIDNVQRTTNDLLRISGKHDTRLNEHDRRLNANGPRHARKEDPPSDNDPVTMKDVKRALWVAGAVLTLIGGVLKYGPVVLKAIAP